jgi:hypothetical protein
MRVLAAGRFKASGHRRIGLAAWTADSGQLLGIAHPGGFVNTVSGARVYLGGFFELLDGRKRPRLGAVDLASGRATDWNPSWNSDRRCTPLALAAAGSRVFVGATVSRSQTSPRARGDPEPRPPQPRRYYRPAGSRDDEEVEDGG